MKAIILAAGMGNRLLHLTMDAPKCKLKVGGKPIIERQLDIFRAAGIEDISIVKGFMGDQINYGGTKSYYNDDYKNNNVLASLFYAEKELNDDVIVAYSDIIFDKGIIEKMLKAEGDICIAINKNINPYNPFEGIEKVSVNGNKIIKIGKHLESYELNGEFIGVIRFSKRGADILKKVYHEVSNGYSNKKFQSAPSVNKAYLTDIVQELIDRGYVVNFVLNEWNWTEIDNVEDLKRVGGEISATKITPEARRGLLKNILAEKGFARIIEAHNGISAIIANNAIVGSDKTSFDGIWISSLTESAARGQPDIEIMGLDSRLATASQILEVTNKPIIVDGDTGGDPNAFEYFVRKAESLGVSAVIIEDKVYPKRNSLDEDSEHILENPKIFAHKIRRGKNALLTNDFMIIARIESFIAGKGIDDAIGRAKQYLEAEVDGIMIHSKLKSPDEIISFARRYKHLCSELGIIKPLICVPTTYNSIKEYELRKEGFNIIIHANHLLRVAIKSMQNVCKIILENERSLEAEQYCSSVNEIFDIVGFSDIKNKEKIWR